MVVLVVMVLVEVCSFGNIRRHNLKALLLRGSRLARIAFGARLVVLVDPAVVGAGLAGRFVKVPGLGPKLASNQFKASLEAAQVPGSTAADQQRCQDGT